MKSVSRNHIISGALVVALLVTGALATAAALVSEWAADTVTADLRRHVDALTQPEMEGRRVGSAGHDLARDYITEQFRKAGLEPAGTKGWYTPARVAWRARMGRSTELRIDGELLSRGVDFRPLGFSDSTSVTAPIAFLGYGISDPHRGWDDYAGLDVTGRVVVVFTDGPLETSLTEAQLTDDSKAATALAKGAVGLLLINSPRTHGDLPEQRPDELGELRASDPLQGLAAGKLTHRAGARAMATLGLDLEALQTALDEGGEPASKMLGADLIAEVTLAVDRDFATVDNIVGRLPGTASDTPASPIIIGAHYDHLGEGIAGSLWEGEPMVHPGADDNASGVAVIIETARQVSKSDSQRPIYVVATTAEEVGMRGARRLAASFPAAQRGTFINLDMVGRLRDPGLHVLGLERSKSFERRIVESAAETAGVEVVAGELYDSPSDHIAFSEAGFEAFHLTTGRHPDYHQPTDTADALNFEGMQRVTQFVTLVVTSMAKE